MVHPLRGESSDPLVHYNIGKSPYGGGVVIWDVEPLATLSQVGIVIIDGQIAYRRKAGESNVDYQKL